MLPYDEIQKRTNRWPTHYNVLNTSINSTERSVTRISTGHRVSVVGGNVRALDKTSHEFILKSILLTVSSRTAATRYNFLTLIDYFHKEIYSSRPVPPHNKDPSLDKRKQTLRTGICAHLAVLPFMGAHTEQEGTHSITPTWK